MHFLSRGNIPDLHAPVCATRGEQAAIRANGHAMDFAGWPGVVAYFSPGCGFPQADRPILARRGEKSAIPAAKVAISVRRTQPRLSKNRWGCMVVLRLVQTASLAD